MDKGINIFLLAVLFIIGVNCFAAEKDSIVFGIPPWGGNVEEAKDRFSTFRDYLSEKTGKKVNFTVTDDYDQLGEYLNNGIIDFAIISSSAYVKAKDKYPKIRYLCSPLTHDMKDTYESNIIVRKDSGIKSYKDLKDKKFAFVDESSSSGYKFPLSRMLNGWKIDPKTYFKKVLFLGNHPDVVKAVYERQADAGAVYESWKRDVEKLGKDEIIMLEIIENIPRDGVAVSPNMDSQTEKKIKEALLSIDKNTKTKEGKNVVEKLSWAGFIEKNDKYYDIIRETNKTIKGYKIY